MRARFCPSGIEITCDSTKEREIMKAWLATPYLELDLVYYGFSRTPWRETPETNRLPMQVVIGHKAQWIPDKLSSVEYKMTDQALSRLQKIVGVPSDETANETPQQGVALPIRRTERSCRLIRWWRSLREPGGGVC